MKARELKDKQHKLYQARVKDAPNHPPKPLEPNSMFESVNVKKPSNYKFNFR